MSTFGGDADASVLDKLSLYFFDYKLIISAILIWQLRPRSVAPTLHPLSYRQITSSPLFGSLLLMCQNDG